MMKRILLLALIVGSLVSTMPKAFANKKCSNGGYRITPCTETTDLQTGKTTCSGGTYEVDPDCNYTVERDGWWECQGQTESLTLQTCVRVNFVDQCTEHHPNVTIFRCVQAK